MSHRPTVEAWLSAFCRGDLSGLAVLLSPGFTIQGPLLDGADQATWLAQLAADPLTDGDYCIERFVEDATTAVAFYRLSRPGGPDMTVAQWLAFAADGRVKSTWLVFDPGAIPRPEATRRHRSG